MLPGSSDVYLVSQQQRELAVQQWLEQGRMLASDVLERHEPEWQKLMERLLKEEAISGDMIRACFEGEMLETEWPVDS